MPAIMAISRQQTNLKAFGGYELSLLSEQGQRKIRPVLIAASVAFALLYFFSLQVKKIYIEQDLASRSLAGLSNEDINIVFFGRDALVTGTVASAREAAGLIDKVAHVWGVRKVNNQLYVSQLAAQDFENNNVAKKLIETGQVTLSGLEFPSSSAVLSEIAENKLNDVLQAMQAMPGAVFKVSGHTDAANTFALSLKRAEAVKAYLVQHGIQEKQLVTQGYGDRQPIADNRTTEGRRRNRRIDIIQLKPGMLN